MFESISQLTSTAQFFLYGRSHFTRTGWEKAIRQYEKPDILDSFSLDLSNKVYIVTGANSGIGKEIATFLAKRQGIVYIICRNQQRAEVTRKLILRECSDNLNNSKTNNNTRNSSTMARASSSRNSNASQRESTGNNEDEGDTNRRSSTASSNVGSGNGELKKGDRVRLLIGDCSLESDIRRVWSEFLQSQQELFPGVPPRLDALICNAGALLNEKTLTSEGVEVTFAAHLLFGVYLLGKLALNSGVLQGTESSRLIVVSSGGMYNTKFPSWDVATSTSTTIPYDGQFAYAYAKRGQVLLCERWAEQYPTVKFVTVHPGWVATPGLEEAYGESKKNFEPLRTSWQGAEGIIWLAVADTEKIENGAFYLDRKPQPKHMAGVFFSEGSFTKNTKEEIDDMMNNLQQWSLQETRDKVVKERMKRLPLQALTNWTLDISQVASGRWYVLANIPTSTEVGVINCIETYRYNAEDDMIRAKFEYQPKEDSKAMTFLEMRGKIKNRPHQTHWVMDPKFLGVHVPLALDLLFLDIPEDYSYCIACTPDRSALWIMTRDTPAKFPKAGYTIHDVYALDIDDEEDAKYTLQESRRVSVDISSAGYAAQKLLRERKFFKDIVLPKLEEFGFDASKVLRCGWTLWD